MFNPYVILVAVFVYLASVSGAYLKGHAEGVQDADAKWNAAYQALEQKRQQMIEESTARFIEAEAKNLQQTQEWEKADNERDKEIRDLRVVNGRFFAGTGGMFDKNGRPTGRGGGNAPGAAAGTPGAPDGGTPGCILSAELEEFLQSEAERADRAAAYAQLGHSYALEVAAYRARMLAKEKATP